MVWKAKWDVYESGLRKTIGMEFSSVQNQEFCQETGRYAIMDCAVQRFRHADWLWWQYKEGPDYNYFNGDDAKFQEILEGHVVTPPPPTDNKYTGTVVSGPGVNVRTGPGISFNKIAALTKYTEVVGTELTEVSPTEEWLKINYPMDGWIATKYNGQELVTIETA